MECGHVRSKPVHPHANSVSPAPSIREDRSMLPQRPEARRLLAGVLLSFIGRGLTLPFLFIYLTDVRGLSDALAGIAVGWFGVVVLAGSPISGTLIDRYGARPVLIAGTTAQLAGSLALAFAATPLTVFAALTVAAAGNAPAWSGNTVLLTTLTGEQERQRVFGLQFTLLNLGVAVGGLIAGAIVDVTRPATFQLIYLLDGATFLVPLAILLTMPGVGGRIARDPSPARVTGGYRTVLRDRPFRRLVLFGLVLTTCGYAQVEVGFAAFSVRVADVSPRVVSLALAANSVTIVLAQLAVVRLLQGRSRSLALSMVGALFGLSWLVLGAGGLAGSGAPLAAALAVIGCAVVFSLGETLLQPVMPALTNALATDELRGRYNAVNSINFGISGIIGPISAGPLIGAGHGTLWIGLLLTGCLVASLLALSLRRLLTPAQDGFASAAAQPAPAG
ncbi:MFS transporter [Actinoplanes sp. NPDC051851]|uniref:MFS transporter n=1 Tax=Actinoplanes sp. NPDC051851 TaxID=3154753 RepID=UPI0034407070